MGTKRGSIQVLEAFEKAGKRVHVVGNSETGVIVALDMEGRLFTVLNGEILNRVNFEAIKGQSTRTQYLNPGGDGLWPAPEGTTLGYQYSTSTWRVSPSVLSARYLVTASEENNATIVAEVDLINNRGVGIPVLFKRQINIEPIQNEITVNVVESITYIGRKPLSTSECMLAPWTLCQFYSGVGCEVVFPGNDQTCVWDLYNQKKSTDIFREGGICRVQTNGSQRYQIALGPDISWIEYHDPINGLKVRRIAGLLPRGHFYIDIRDVAPDTVPDKKGVRYSVYSDPENFMELEAVGGCPETILPGTEMKIVVTTYFSKI